MTQLEYIYIYIMDKTHFDTKQWTRPILHQQQEDKTHFENRKMCFPIGIIGA